MRTTSGSDRRAPGGAGAREPEGSTLSVRVVPGAARDSLENDPTRGWIVRVAAPPVDGRGNERVCAFVAREVLGVAPSRVRVKAGASGRTKVLAIDVPPAALAAALAAWGAR